MTLNSLANRTLQPIISQPANPEKKLVDDLVQALTQSGIGAAPLSVINFYVALKTRPLTILTGPAQVGKIAIVQCLARFLMGGDCQQCQMMIGHPWYADKSDNVAFFTEVQSRFIGEKLLSLIEEAWQPENSKKVFIACLTRISPAELLNFFIELASQLRHGELVRLGDVHLSRPIPYPPNLFLIGTMDTDYYRWWDADLLPQTTVIEWPGNRVEDILCPSFGDHLPALQEEFLRSCVRSERAVYQKLYSVLGWQRQPVWPLFLVEALLGKHDIALPPSVSGEVMAYLANAWSIQGNGLFDLSGPHNLAIALDLSFRQTLLPRAAEAIRRNLELQKGLVQLLNSEFPRSVAYLQSIV
jgi:hypothetical protein